MPSAHRAATLPARGRAPAPRRAAAAGRPRARWHCAAAGLSPRPTRSEEHTSELQSRSDLVCRLLLEKKKKKRIIKSIYKCVIRSVNETETLASKCVVV